MFVQEEKIFAGKVLRLHVCTMEGAEWLEEVPEDTTVEKLKERCLKHRKQEQKAPDKDAILKATANLPSRNVDRTVAHHNMRDFQTELRKILVSLIEVAQKLLALNPDAVELFKKANGQTPAEATAEAGASSAEATAGPSSEAGGEEAKDELTEIFKKIRRKREFRPDPRCEWLLGDRKPSPEDLDKGIDTNSPLFQAILENPVVQLGLTNPKTLLGTLCDLEQGVNDESLGGAGYLTAPTNVPWSFVH
ncbi:ubiquitin-associated hypothetical protein [Limosa lapponica baueri]|uniref:Uncharacterized protein n=1 Tax=Limosa lapponica baueri TaxID=1758121 RepID=A0A2I0TG64_LIMLA|nr:ubiquitin-associated hypothetical protein [Limosa lapponica baueri]